MNLKEELDKQFFPADRLPSLLEVAEWAYKFGRDDQVLARYVSPFSLPDLGIAPGVSASRIGAYRPGCEYSDNAPWPPVKITNIEETE